MLWSEILEWLGKPGGAAISGLDALLKGQNPIMGAWKGATGEDRKIGRDLVQTVRGGEATTPFGKAAEGVAGFGADLLIDPLNFIPVAKAGKLVSGAMGGVRKGIDAVSPLRSLAESTIPYYAQRGAYKGAAKLRDKELTAARSAAFDDSITRFQPLLPDDPTAANAAMREAQFAVEAGQRNTPLERELAKWADEQRDFKIREGLLKPDEVKPNYVPHTGIRPKATAGYKDVPPKFPTLAKAVEEGYGVSDDLIETTAKRATEDAEKAIRNRFFRDLLTNKDFADVVKPASQAPADFVPLKVSLPDDLAMMAGGIRVHPMVAKDMDNLLRVADSPTPVGKFIDSLVNNWKQMATVITPGFHTRNFVSNVALNIAGGMRPQMAGQRYLEAAKFLRGEALDGVPANALEQARKWGVVGTEFGVVGDFGDAAQRALRESGKRHIPEGVPLIGGARATPFGVGREAGQRIEDISRAALFIDQLKKGVDMRDAALHTSKWMVDYSASAPWDKGIGRVVPFFKWARGVTPLIVETTLKNPKLVASIEKLKQEVESYSDDRDRPDYIERLEGIRLPFKGDRNEALFMNLGLPGPDVNILPNPLNPISSLGGAADQLMGSVNPMIKLIPELLVNRSTFTGKQIGYPNINSPRPNTGLTALAQLLTLGQYPQKPFEPPASISYSLDQLFPPLSLAGRAAGLPMGRSDPAKVGGFPLGALRAVGSPVTVSAESPAQRKRRRDEERRQRQRR